MLTTSVSERASERSLMSRWRRNLTGFGDETFNAITRTNTENGPVLLILVEYWPSHRATLSKGWGRFYISTVFTSSSNCGWQMKWQQLAPKSRMTNLSFFNGLAVAVESGRLSHLVTLHAVGIYVKRRS